MPSKDKSAVSVHDLAEILNSQSKTDQAIAVLLAKIDLNVSALKNDKLVELVLVAGILVLACQDSIGPEMSKIILAILGLAGAAIGYKLKVA